jgi:HlyD family secretion protein
MIFPEEMIMQKCKLQFKKKWMKWMAPVAAVAIVAGSIFAAQKVSAASKSAASTTTFVKTVAKNGNIDITVSGNGTVSDASNYSLTSPNAGTIDKLPVKQGDTVTAGQVIAHINNPSSAQSVSQQQSALQNAENNLEQSEESLHSLNVKAPAAGRVKSILVSSGDDLSQMSKSMGSLAVISTKGTMTVNIAGSKLSVGDGVTVTDSAKGQTYSGTVTSVTGQAGAVVTVATDLPGVGDSVTVKKGTAEVGNGMLALSDSVPVQSSGSGTISSVNASENQIVSKGQILFNLDSTLAENQIKAMQAAVSAAQSQLAAAKTAQGKDTITSPVKGVIAELDVKNGDSLSSGAAVATIINPNSMQTVVSVDELDISKVKLGQKANVTMNAASGKSFSGAVSQIDPIGTSSNGVTDYNVTVTIDNPTNVMVGMTTSADIITQSKSNTIIVPANAILEKSGNHGYVIDADKVFDTNGKSMKLDNISTRELVQKYGIQVTIGLSNVNEDEITSGISSGTSLAIPTTVNKAALASLSSNQGGSTNNYSMFGGSRNGYSGSNGGYSKRSGTGNTVAGTAGAGNTSSKDSNASSGTDAAGTAGGTGNHADGSVQGSGNSRRSGGNYSGSGN